MFVFACHVNRVVDNERSSDEMWCVAGFFVMLAAFLNIVLLSMESYDKIAKIITIIMLVIGFLFTIVAGGVDVDENCNDSTNCGLLIFGNWVLLPAFLCLILAIDLFNQFANSARIRIIVFSVIMFLVSTLICAAMFDQDQDHLTDEQKCYEVGMLLICISSLIILIVHGAIGKTSIAILNAFVAFLLWIGAFLLLVSDSICQALFVVWYMNVLSVIYLLSSEAQSGGTIRLRRGT